MLMRAGPLASDSPGTTALARGATGLVLVVVVLAGCSQSGHETPGLKLLKQQPMAYFTPATAQSTDKTTQYRHRKKFFGESLDMVHDSVDWTLIPKPGLTSDVVAREVSQAAARDGWKTVKETPENAIQGTPWPAVWVRKSSPEGTLDLSCILDVPPLDSHLLCGLTFSNQPDPN